MLAGHSLSGSFSLFTLLEKPDLFNAVISGSPGPIDPLIPYLSNENINNSAPILYSSIGSQDFTDTTIFRKFEGKLNALIPTSDYNFEVHDGETHFTNLVLNLQDGLLYLYQNWSFTLPEQFQGSAVALIKKHYAGLEEKFGHEIKPGEWDTIFPIMDRLAKKGDFHSAIELLRWCVELYPDSDQAYAFLAKAHFDIGQPDKGKEYLEKALFINPQNTFALRMKAMVGQ